MDAEEKKLTDAYEKQDECVFVFSANGIHWCSNCKFGPVPGHACDAP